jgi:hypothetical protein
MLRNKKGVHNIIINDYLIHGIEEILVEVKEEEILAKEEED